MSTLTEPQRRMYASETTQNFRLVAKLFTRPSSHVLTSNDLTDVDLQEELAEIGQFAEVAHGKLSPRILWTHLEHLLQPGFPLHDYRALEGSDLLCVFRGKVADMQGYIAYRAQTAQLVVAFSGTSSVNQSLHNFDVRLVAYPGGDKCAVHSGFWKLYQGVQSQALEELSRACSSRTVDEVVFTGHSLGAAMCYLFMLDVMGVGGSTSRIHLPPTCRLKFAGFGSPKVGNLALAQHWRTVVADSSARGISVKEYSVKGYNDGVPSIPPYFLGYRHFAQTPLYYAQGQLYHIPASESEWSYFTIQPSDDGRERFEDHPLGGHNYYNRRDMEKLLRRLKWLDSETSKDLDWERYGEWLRNECEREMGVKTNVS